MTDDSFDPFDGGCEADVRSSLIARDPIKDAIRQLGDINLQRGIIAAAEYLMEKGMHDAAKLLSDDDRIIMQRLKQADRKEDRSAEEAKSPNQSID
jgi:hypothetical protein